MSSRTKELSEDGLLPSHLLFVIHCHGVSLNSLDYLQCRQDSSRSAENWDWLRVLPRTPLEILRFCEHLIPAKKKRDFCRWSFGRKEEEKEKCSEGRRGKL